MNRVIAITAGAAAVATLAVGCSSSTKNSVSSPPSSSAPAATTALHAQSSKYGQILVDGSGRTLYLLTADTGAKSSCNGTCTSVWPPDHTTGTPTNSGVTASLVGTTTRTDHTAQVTYKGHPLYTFAQDSKAGDVNGEGIASFGGTWYVVGVDGNAITSVPSTAPSTTPSTPAPSPSTGGYGY
ncbi:putative lipoprotein with Yx(FWY)xxD motif [Streptacidiphilus sp. MAP12-20]|uniref:COG4315 family predicted lipoprotein n=1 Tax=Streptacidiphilus sp. MAP12-20 TaxID=3156299 RepID=UPI0035171AFB